MPKLHLFSALALLLFCINLARFHDYRAITFVKSFHLPHYSLYPLRT